MNATSLLKIQNQNGLKYRVGNRIVKQKTERKVVAAAGLSGLRRTLSWLLQRDLVGELRTLKTRSLQTFRTHCWMLLKRSKITWLSSERFGVGVGARGKQPASSLFHCTNSQSSRRLVKPNGNNCDGSRVRNSEDAATSSHNWVLVVLAAASAAQNHQRGLGFTFCRSACLPSSHTFWTGSALKSLANGRLTATSHFENSLNHSSR